MKYLIPLAALLLVSCDDDKKRPPPQPLTKDWDMSSSGLVTNAPTERVENADGSWSFTLVPGQRVGYVTKHYGSLKGKSNISLTISIEPQAENAKIQGSYHDNQCTPGEITRITLYFAQDNHDWVNDGQRWWATFASKDINPDGGEYTITADLDSAWTSVMFLKADDPSFAYAKANAGRVGFTFGNCTGYGHGAISTGPVKITVKSFTIN